MSRASVLHSDKPHNVYDIRHPWPDQNSPHNHNDKCVLLLDSLQVKFPEYWKMDWPQRRNRTKL